jgi:large subunit ribosomal protein L6
VSRIGRLPIHIPDRVQVSIDGPRVSVKGPKGQLTWEFDPRIQARVDQGRVVVSRSGDEPKVRALHGLTRALIANMVTGVSEGYSKSLEIVGLGYRAEVQGNSLNLQVGYSHPVRFPAPSGISFEVDKSGRVITVAGIDKELVGRVAAEIRAVREPEPYRGKGIRYVGEHVRRKAGKAGKVTAA